MISLSSSLHQEELAVPFSATPDSNNVLFIQTGGTENKFLKLWQEGEICHSAPVFLFTTGQSNSLAASMEILAYLNAHGGRGQIIHGDMDYLRGQMDVLSKAYAAKQSLNGKRIGVIGAPSDWLIASDFNSSAIKTKLGTDITMIDMQELTGLLTDAEGNAAIDGGKDGAKAIYDALKQLIGKYNLNALTLRCFDLLPIVHNTGCLALAMLNAEGIPSSCEGDVPTLLTMMISNALTNCPGFQANPARIKAETGEILFAHCTIPLNMVSNVQYPTHFESGIGVALHGELPEGDVTVFKTSGDLSRLFVQDATLLRNQYEQNLCRTQIWLKMPGAADYFFTNPIANHHVIMSGHHAELIKTFFKCL